MIRHTVIFNLKHAQRLAPGEGIPARCQTALEAIPGVEVRDSSEQVSKKNDYHFRLLDGVRRPAGLRRL